MGSGKLSVIFSGASIVALIPKWFSNFCAIGLRACPRSVSIQIKSSPSVQAKRRIGTRQRTHNHRHNLFIGYVGFLRKALSTNARYTKYLGNSFRQIICNFTTKLGALRAIWQNGQFERDLCSFYQDPYRRSNTRVLKKIRYYKAAQVEEERRPPPTRVDDRSNLFYR